MRLATKTIVIDHPGGQSLALRPSLRAAFDLSHQYDSLQNLWNAIARGSVVALCDVIRAGTSNDDSALAEFIERGNLPLNVSIELLVPKALEFIEALAGSDQQQEQIESSTPKEEITFAVFHERLFAIATGWLGWPPKDAWAATPAELLVAYKGHTERLKAIHGSKEAEDKGKTTDLTALDSEARKNALKRFGAIGDLTKHTVP
jgi:hypothetical protein